MHKREFLYILSKLYKVFTQQQSLPVLAVMTWLMSVGDGSLVDSLSPSVGARVRDSLCSPAPAYASSHTLPYWHPSSRTKAAGEYYFLCLLLLANPISPSFLFSMLSLGIHQT